jgi:hypothetical protein
MQPIGEDATNAGVFGPDMWRPWGQNLLARKRSIDGHSSETPHSSRSAARCHAGVVGLGCGAGSLTLGMAARRADPLRWADGGP